jgi:hypothetical protein
MATAQTEAQLIALIRKGIRQIRPTTVKDDDISLSIETAIDILGQILVQADPQYFEERKSIAASYAPHIFSAPSDLFRLDWVKDLGTNAGTITGATNASPIVVTESSHGRTTGNIVTIHDVVGNTSANGTWKITRVDADTYSLDGSTGNDAYTSGGKVFEDKNDFAIIYRKPTGDADNNSPAKWLPRKNKIIVDSPSFTNDILIGYVERPDSVSDIPAEFHRIGLESFGVIDNIEVPTTKDPKYYDIKASYEKHLARWALAQERAIAWKFSTESRNVNLSRRVSRSMI